MIRIDLLTSPDCAHRDEVRVMLAPLRAVRPELVVSEVDATSPGGLRVSIAHGIFITPGVIVRGEQIVVTDIEPGGIA